jgi:hypothetical protein
MFPGMTSQKRMSRTAVAFVAFVGGFVTVAAYGFEDAAVKPKETSGTVSLFDGRSLDGWVATDFGGAGEVRVEDERILLEQGEPMTGITIKPERMADAMPTIGYELSFEAMRVAGNDFFCGLTFPVGDKPCSFIVGGWGGTIVGLSSLDGQDASQNDTMSQQAFKTGQWYRFRLRVEKVHIQAWIDDERVIDANTKDREIGIRIEVERSRPLGFSCYNTTAALRAIKVRKL